MINGPDAVYVIAQHVLAGALAALTAGPTEAPRRSGIVNGAQAAWDTCETDCGLLALTHTRTFLSDAFPQQLAVGEYGCGSSAVAVEYLIQLVRCAPVPDEKGNGPSMNALDLSAQQNLTDGRVLLQGVQLVLCALSESRDVADYMIGAANPVGPLGGCVGTQVGFTVQILGMSA